MIDDEEHALRPKDENIPKFYSQVRWAPCSLGRACSFVMVPFVFAMMALTYVPYVAHFAIGTAKGTLLLIVFHLLLILTLVSYFQTVFTDPGTVPLEWHNKVAGRLKPAYKKCRHTNLYRPLRSQYCTITRRVVLNFDHFCPWVANAVGFHNRKFFVLFCFYGTITCAFSAATLGPSALSFDTDANATAKPLYRALALLAVIMDISFTIALMLFSLVHFYLAAKNLSSLEDSKVSMRYDCGWYVNMTTVFGKDSRFWLLPSHFSQLEGDGVYWRLRDGSWDGQPYKELESEESV